MRLPNFLDLLFSTAFASGPMLLTIKQTCHELGVSPATLQRYCASVPGFPRKVQLGPRRVAFRREEVERYAKTGTIHAESGH